MSLGSLVVVTTDSADGRNKEKRGPYFPPSIVALFEFWQFFILFYFFRIGNFQDYFLISKEIFVILVAEDMVFTFCC